MGDGPITYSHMSKLTYIQACLREALRLDPTAPAFGREVSKDTPEPCIIGGKYMIPKGVPVICLLPQLHRDPAVYGDDAKEFKPERMLEEEFEKLPAAAWKPFGTGPRACIGRPFAWQEAIMALAMVLQNFDLRLVDPSYELRIKQTLTIKPDGLKIHAIPRRDNSGGQLEKRLYGGVGKQPTNERAVITPGMKKAGKPLTILWAGNTGTCEGLAQTMASAAAAHGFDASVVSLDSATGRLPNNQPLVIITASFEGEPADNAGQFVEWLKHVDGDKLKGVKYSVFGCGHHDWVATFQRVPKLIDSTLAEKGASRLSDRGESDVAMGTVLDDFDEWLDGILWPSLGAEDQDADIVSALDIEVSTSTRVTALKQSVQEALVMDSQSLSGAGVSEKRMIRFALPTGVSYRSGDYLSVLPLNSQQTVGRVLRRFGLAWDAEMTIKAGSHTAMPVGAPVSVTLALSTFVELNATASKKSILSLSKLADKPETKAAIEALSTQADPKSKTSVLEILEKYPDLPVPFGLFISMLPAMRIRQYSISSSPLVDPATATITYNVLDVPIEGVDKHFLGVTTNYLKNLQIGDRALISIKGSHYSFHLPTDNAKPVIMVCAGTGIAPFRGFVEERAAKLQSGQKLGPAMLFIGCTKPSNDKIYEKELEEWSRLGAVEVFYAFSRDSDASKGCKYAQDRVWEEREKALELFEGGAKVFVCGANRLGGGVKDVSKKIYLDQAKKLGEEKDDEDAEKWFNNLKVQERWTSDIFD